VRAAPLLLACLAAAPAALAATADRDLVPGGKVLSTIAPSAEVETFRVVAPAGSELLVDLRPLRRGAFTPLLAATLADESEAAVPAPIRGRTRVRLPFPADGTLELRVSATGGGGDYLLRTRLRCPGSAPFAGSVEEPGGEAALDLFVPANCRGTLRVRADRGSGLVPRLLALDGEEEGLDLPTVPGPAADAARGFDFPLPGSWTLRVGGADGSTGGFAGTLARKVRKGPSLDLRDAATPEALSGTYAVLLAAAPAGPVLPVVFTGSALLDGRGGVRTALSTRTLAADAGGPFGFSLDGIPVEADGGTYWTDGTAATVSLDLDSGSPLVVDGTVAAGGDVVYTGFGPGSAPAAGLLLRNEVPTVPGLAGSWLYVDAVVSAESVTTVEIGTLNVGSGGTVGGLGLATTLDLAGELPSPGEGSPVFRSGSLSVGEDGTLSITTVPNLFGSPDTWTARPLLGTDILVGVDAEGGGLRLFLRQGTGLTEADLAGSYLHVGLALGAALEMRSGLLTLDGEGGWTGTEAVVDLAGGTPETVEGAGTYSVTTAGLATFALDGGASGNGVVGPEGRYLLSVSLGGGGLGLDLLLSLEP
jgi:hypothetical protein